MRRTVKDWQLYRRTSVTLADLAKLCNATLRGWWNYYGAFYQNEMQKLSHYVDDRLRQWARRKYKALKGRRARSADWLHKMKECYPKMFFHWTVGRV